MHLKICKLWLRSQFFKIHWPYRYIQCLMLLAQVPKVNVLQTKYNSAYMQVYKFTVSIQE